MTHPVAKLMANEATSTPTWKPWPSCQRQAAFQPKPQHFNGEKTKHTPTWQTPEWSSCLALLTLTEQKLSQIQVGHIQAKRTFLISYVHAQITHSKISPTTDPDRQAQSKTAWPFPLSTCARCWVPLATQQDGKGGSQDIYAGFLGPTPARQRTGHHQVNLMTLGQATLLLHF